MFTSPFLTLRQGIRRSIWRAWLDNLVLWLPWPFKGDFENLRSAGHLCGGLEKWDRDPRSESHIDFISELAGLTSIRGKRSLLASEIAYQDSERLVQDSHQFRSPATFPGSQDSYEKPPLRLTFWAYMALFPTLLPPLYKIWLSIWSRRNSRNFDCGRSRRRFTLYILRIPLANDDHWVADAIQDVYRNKVTLTTCWRPGLPSR